MYCSYYNWSKINYLIKRCIFKYHCTEASIFLHTLYYIGKKKYIPFVLFCWMRFYLGSLLIVCILTEAVC